MPHAAGDFDDELGVGPEDDDADVEDADDDTDESDDDEHDEPLDDSENAADDDVGSNHRAARHVDDEGAYVCGSCGEEIVVPLDRTGGEHQSYVEDCPVCCVPNEITVDFDEDGSARVFARPE